MRRNYTKSSFGETWLEDGIIHQVISPKVKKITLEIAKQLVDDRENASGTVGLNVRVLVIVNNAVSVDKEAKEYYKEPRAYKNIIAIAMFVDNYVARMVGNIIFKINKPFVPTSFFNDKTKAIHWLRGFENLN